MSANHVSNDLINFLIAAAIHCGRRMGNQTGKFCWSRRDGTLAELTQENVKRTGQMLRDENTSCLNSRHERGLEADEPSLNFPTQSIVPIGQIRTAEILKAADYYEYQSSQHPGWPESNAREFIECLRAATWMTMPEYRRARWGEPEHVRSYYRATPEPTGATISGTPAGRAGFIRDLREIPAVKNRDNPGGNRRAKPPGTEMEKAQAKRQYEGKVGQHQAENQHGRRSIQSHDGRAEHLHQGNSHPHNARGLSAALDHTGRVRREFLRF